MLTSDDVVSCCMDLNAPSISFRINGQPVQGMFENFNTDGLFFPVVSFSAGVKYAKLMSSNCVHVFLCVFFTSVMCVNLNIISFCKIKKQNIY